jgi:hypothetical protein
MIRIQQVPASAAAFAAQCLMTRPSFITKVTRFSAVMSCQALI